MGRHATPTELHKLRGTYREDRHGDRLDAVVGPSGALVKPRWLKGEAAAAWDLIVASLPPEVLGACDVFMLASACRWFALWRRFDLQLQSGRGDTSERLRRARDASVQFQACAMKLGLSPVDRAKIRTQGTQKKDEDGKGRFFTLTG